MEPQVSFQINVAPSDIELSRHLLPRQVSRMEPYVDEIVISFDERRGDGRFGQDFDQNCSRMRDLLAATIDLNKKVRLCPVDYSESTQKAIKTFFCQNSDIPIRDLRGGPSYVYFHGIWSCQNDHVFHIDADMLFGGDVGDWFARAVVTLQDRSVLSVAPLPGPPTFDGLLRQPLLDQICLTEDRSTRIYTFDGFSTRVFFMDRRRLSGIQMRGLPTAVRTLKALGRQMSPHELPEVMISRFMRANHLVRVDFSSSGGFYTLHPPYKSKEFYQQIERLILDVECDAIPDGQRGCYDINDSLYDYSKERETLRNRAWPKRLARYLTFGKFGQ